MPRRNRPPPLNLNFDTRPKNLPRVSRTPAISEATPLVIVMDAARDLEHKEQHRRRSSSGSTSKLSTFSTASQVALDFLHMTLCMLLLVVMAEFLVRHNGVAISGTSANAVALVVTLGADAALDVQSIIGLLTRTYNAYCLIARAILTCAYAGLLVSYAVVGHAFTEDYAYWGGTPQQGSDFAVAALCCIVLWNIAHLVMLRRRITELASVLWANRQSSRPHHRLHSASSGESKSRRQAVTEV